MNEQLVLGLTLKEALQKEDFFISSSNLEAVTLLDNIDQWVSGVLLLVGPKGSGKTHLSLVWCKENKAKYLKLESVYQEIEKGLTNHTVCVEDIDIIADFERQKKSKIEEGIFHLINSVGNRGGKLLISSSKMPNALSIGLKDLESRLQSFSKTYIKEPDDSLVMALLLKYFNDRQIHIKHSNLTYIATRINRTYSSIYKFVNYVDHKSLVLNAKLTRPFIDAALKQTEKKY
ncbi:DnaA/Hda family protein [Paracoccaceae bacterium]|nr:DnaA/Hda family protein [Paracoccaceae bacterium]